jgi:hypothetical protein
MRQRTEVVGTRGRRGWRRAAGGSLALLASGVLTACATVTVVPKELLHDQQFVPGTTAVAQVYADNWGIYLFKYIPIFAGDLEDPGVPRMPSLFSDNVRIDRLVEKVSRESRQVGGTVLTDVRVRDRSYWMPYSLIFWLNEYEVSANASQGPSQ